MLLNNQEITEKNQRGNQKIPENSRSKKNYSPAASGTETTFTER